MAIESPAATNEDFNLSTAESTTVLELAEMIWRKIKRDEPFRYVSDEPYTYDVQKRVPSVEKARRVLGFEATTTPVRSRSTRSSPGSRRRSKSVASERASADEDREPRRYALRQPVLAPGGRRRRGSGRRSARRSSRPTSRPTRRSSTVGAGYCDFINRIVRPRGGSPSTPTRTPAGSRPRGSRSIACTLERLARGDRAGIGRPGDGEQRLRAPPRPRRPARGPGGDPRGAPARGAG